MAGIGPWLRRLARAARASSLRYGPPDPCEADVSAGEGQGYLPRIDCALVRLAAADDRMLDGLLYEAKAGSSTTAVLHLHGKGGNCYSGPGRFIPSLAGDGSITHFALNMRCHDLGYTRYDTASADFTIGGPPVDGGWWEKIPAGVLDVAAGVSFLRRRGHPKVVICGHSSGGLYGIAYAHEQGAVDGLVLLSPLVSNATAIPVWFPTEEARRDAMERATELVESGRGHEILPVRAWFYGVSAQMLLDRMGEDPSEFRRKLLDLRIPVCMAWGIQESRDAEWREIYHGMKSERKSILTFDTDHHFTGCERALTNGVIDFVDAL